MEDTRKTLKVKNTWKRVKDEKDYEETMDGLIQRLLECMEV